MGSNLDGGIGAGYRNDYQGFRKKRGHIKALKRCFRGQKEKFKRGRRHISLKVRNHGTHRIHRNFSSYSSSCFQCIPWLKRKLNELGHRLDPRTEPDFFIARTSGGFDAPFSLATPKKLMIFIESENACSKASWPQKND